MLFLVERKQFDEMLIVERVSQFVAGIRFANSTDVFRQDCQHGWLL